MNVEKYLAPKFKQAQQRQKGRKRGGYNNLYQEGDSSSNNAKGPLQRKGSRFQDYKGKTLMYNQDRGAETNREQERKIVEALRRRRSIL